MRLKNILDSFSDFNFNNLSMNQQQEDYKSKYLDLYEKVKNERGEGSKKVSILEDVDFELELIHKDDVNVSYILKLFARYRDAKGSDKENISNIINGNTKLRSKKELIEKFINENLMKINDSESVEAEFDKFWNQERVKAFDNLCEEENLHKDEVKNVVDTYLYDERKPLNDDIVKTLLVKPKLLQRKKIVPRVLQKIISFVEKFYES